jgi:hypothetical protein
MVQSVTSTIILDFLFLEHVKKYQGSFIKTNVLKNQKPNQTLSLFVLHEGNECYNEPTT